MKILTVVGTRPNITKVALLYKAMAKEFDCILVHTGQHYDKNMSKDFFQELDLPMPNANLGVGSGTHAGQTARTMLNLEYFIETQKPNLVLVTGDTNASLSGALTAAKMGIPVCHVEAGVRCGDVSQPEEINRKVIDHISTLNLAPTLTAAEYLKQEQCPYSLTGDIMLDNFLFYSRKDFHRLTPTYKGFIYVTVHRAENTNGAERLAHIFAALDVLTKEWNIVLPLHPRTNKMLKQYGIKTKVEVIEPVGYLQSLSLTRNAFMVITDSGGLQKEAYWSGTPCVTLSPYTAWRETVDAGGNTLVEEITTDNILRAVKKADKNFNPAFSMFGNGEAVGKTLNALKAWSRANCG